MEWVTQRGGWLYPHPIGINPPAKVMWRFYQDRPDIESEPMGDEMVALLGVAHREEELRRFYRKPNPTIIPVLSADSRWEDRT
jgi:hypothetical protein